MSYNVPSSAHQLPFRWTQVPLVVSISANHEDNTLALYRFNFERLIGEQNCLVWFDFLIYEELHLPPITKTIQVRRTRHAGHCWRSRDELIRDVLLWIPTHGRAKAGRPARTYIQQLCEDTGCCPEDLPRAMNDREEWRERVRDIRAASTIWWWWWWWWWCQIRFVSIY